MCSLIARGFNVNNRHIIRAHLKQSFSCKFFSYKVMEPKEFQVPVPWGHIAGQEWGDMNGEPWIGLHGWLDNSGTFETLAPFFATSGRRLLSIDLPGHGFSSHYPPGLQYHYLDGLQYIRRVAEYFNLKKFNLIGHSMGGGMSMVFTSTHPESVSRLVMLDCIKPITRPLGLVVKRTRESVDDLMNIERKLKNGNESLCTHDEAIKKLLQASDQLHGEGAVTSDSAKILLKRGTKQVDGDLVSFTRDLRQRAGSLYGYSTEVIQEFASHIKCPHLIVKAEDGRFYEDEEIAMSIVDVYKKSNPNFMFTEIAGSHHVHLNDGSAVWKVIESFLKEYPS